MNDQAASYLIMALNRLIEVQERIAVADERRNELLEAEQAARREAWAQDREDRADIRRRLG